MLGARTERELIDLDAPGEIAITGAISTPLAHRASRSGLVLIVNRRLVHNRALAAAFDESYRGLIPAGRHGFGVINVEVALEALDVNVHPAKREVRFREERAVFAAVQRACWAALRAAPAPHAAEFAATAFVGDAALELRDGETRIRLSGRPVIRPGTPTHAVTGSAEPAEPDAGPAAGEIGAMPAPMTALGQAGSGFLVASAGDAVVLVDPHAAHEKILYTELLAHWQEDAERRAAESQLLLIPVVIECGPARAARVIAEHDFFSRGGFSVEPFGPGTIRCTSVPIAAAGADPERLVAELIERLDEPSAGGGERRHRLAALVACHAAVRFGDRLDILAQQRLLDQLAATPGGTTCPHGRPSVLVLDDPTLRRAFRRPAR